MVNIVKTNNKPERKDPVAEAQQAQQAQNETEVNKDAAEDAPQPGDDRGNTPPESVVTETTEASNETPAAAEGEQGAKGTEEKVETEQPVVTDKAAAPSKVLEESLIIKSSQKHHRPSPQQVVQQASGARAREVSPADVVKTHTHIESNGFSSVIAAERKSGTSTAIGLISFMDRYVATMAPRKITSIDTIIKQQEGLLDTLVGLIERAPAKEFNRLWNIAIMYVNEYKDGCFSPMYYSRGARDWKRDPAKFGTLTSLINLLQASATDMASVTKVVDVNVVIGKGFSEDARQRMFAFYIK